MICTQYNKIVVIKFNSIMHQSKEFPIKKVFKTFSFTSSKTMIGTPKHSLKTLIVEQA
ncbi:MAG: hypothetical protein HLUCCX10_03280 [Algoriphagus marincola HL-49]|uniref:Uncharacterized protein n=1 Tax=Algoriphagus marincola HL-49 TaxID=1305737 RepID=A0A0N8KHA7_9BACT|nr:MAG: hypothetical protein HLUCCX10_03280 [Algoriphagus marincola HL-49]